MITHTLLRWILIIYEISDEFSMQDTKDIKHVSVLQKLNQKQLGQKCILIVTTLKKSQYASMILT